MSSSPRTRRPIVMERVRVRRIRQGDRPINRAALESALVGQRYPAYTSELRAFIVDFQFAHQSEPDVERRMLEAIWEKFSFSFLFLSVVPVDADIQGEISHPLNVLTSAKNDALRSYIDAAQKYEEELQELADAEVASRYDEVTSAAMREAAAQSRERGLQADAQAFFNKPDAVADYIYWHQRVVWTAEEATALSFGKDPRRVSLKNLSTLTLLNSSPFRDAFKDRLDIIERAFDAYAGKAAIKPKDSVTWIKCSATQIDTFALRSLLPS